MEKIVAISFALFFFVKAIKCLVSAYRNEEPGVFTPLSQSIVINSFFGKNANRVNGVFYFLLFLFLGTMILIHLDLFDSK